MDIAGFDGGRSDREKESDLVTGAGHAKYAATISGVFSHRTYARIGSVKKNDGLTGTFPAIRRDSISEGASAFRCRTQTVLFSVIDRTGRLAGDGQVVGKGSMTLRVVQSLRKERLRESFYVFNSLYCASTITPIREISQAAAGLSERYESSS